MTSRRLLIVLVALLAIVASGCGGGSDEPSLSDFQDQVVNTRDRVDFALSRVTQAQSKDEFLNRMDEASVAIEAAADDLEDVQPPEKYEPEATELADALHQLSVDLSATATDLRNETFGDLPGVQGLNFDSWDKANAALAGLVVKGIKVELIQRH